MGSDGTAIDFDNEEDEGEEEEEEEEDCVIDIGDSEYSHGVGDGGWFEITWWSDFVVKSVGVEAVFDVRRCSCG